MAVVFAARFGDTDVAYMALGYSQRPVVAIHRWHKHTLPTAFFYPNQVNSATPPVEATVSTVTVIWRFFEPWLTWESIKAFGNSAFTTSLVGALAGAYFGARAAQKVAERSKLREELTKEIRNTNAATAIAFGIVNSMLALKKQHAVPLKKGYDEEKQRHDDWLAKRHTGQIQGNAPYVLKADLRTTPEVVPPIPVLRDIVFGRLSTTGRPLNLVASLGESIESLNTAIAQRNELIEHFKNGAFPSGADLPAMYLALPYGGGHVNQQYADLVNAITSYVDDATFFSHLLCLDLHAYGIEVSDSFKKSFKDQPPRITEVDFKQAEDSGLLPKSDQYQTWFTAFRKAPIEHKRRWWRRSGNTQIKGATL